MYIKHALPDRVPELKTQNVQQKDGFSYGNQTSTNYFVCTSDITVSLVRALIKRA